jgi:hypothetical protein
METQAMTSHTEDPIESFSVGGNVLNPNTGGRKNDNVQAEPDVDVDIIASSAPPPDKGMNCDCHVAV